MSAMGCVIFGLGNGNGEAKECVKIHILYKSLLSHSVECGILQWLLPKISPFYVNINSTFKLPKQYR